MNYPRSLPGLRVRRRMAPILAFAAMLSANPEAHAVSLSAQGSGQVLLFPYFNANAYNAGTNSGLATLLHLTNDSAAGKALKVTFREGQNLRSTLSFNVYLAPYDVWTAVLAADLEAGAELVTLDRSCTVPILRPNRWGQPAARLNNFMYSGVNADGGPTSLDRTREGMIEVIEMGTLVPGTAASDAARRMDTGNPSGCALLEARWLPGGLWINNPGADLSNPTGGLSGSAALIDVANGTLLDYQPEALEGFRQDPDDVPRGTLNSVVLHTSPEVTRPNLADAISDPGRNVASASVLVDGQLVTVDYPAPSQAVDAVTAVFMSSHVSNEFSIEPALGAQSQWVLTFPTRNFYTDREIVGRNNPVPIAPFRSLYTGQPRLGEQGSPCMGLRYVLFDREARSDPSECADCLDFPGLPEARAIEFTQLCYGVQTLNLNQDHPSVADLFSSQLIVPLSWYALPSGSFDGPGFAAHQGWMKINLVDAPELGFDAPNWTARTRPALDGTVFEGLPVIGFHAARYVNANARPDVLANYGGTLRHRTSVKCTRNGRACP